MMTSHRRMTRAGNFIGYRYQTKLPQDKVVVRRADTQTVVQANQQQTAKCIEKVQ